jgi:hypothetical protein
MKFMKTHNEKNSVKMRVLRKKENESMTIIVDFLKMETLLHQF